jgi:phosphoserine phosphatase
VPEINNGRLADRMVGDIVDGAAKAATLVRVMREIGASPAQTVAVGDGSTSPGWTECSIFSSRGGLP